MYINMYGCDKYPSGQYVIGTAEALTASKVPKMFQCASPEASPALSPVYWVLFVMVSVSLCDGISEGPRRPAPRHHAHHTPTPTPPTPRPALGAALAPRCQVCSFVMLSLFVGVITLAMNASIEELTNLQGDVVDPKSHRTRLIRARHAPYVALVAGFPN